MLYKYTFLINSKDDQIIPWVKDIITGDWIAITPLNNGGVKVIDSQSTGEQTLYYPSIFSFKDERDALMFKLRWG